MATVRQMPYMGRKHSRRRHSIGGQDESSGAATFEGSPDADILRLLARGHISSCRELPWGSNYTFLATIVADATQIRAVYKPRRGEAPLWDFPQGTLYLREYASYVLSRGLGWPSIPPTVVRDGPWGIGSFQLYVDPLPGQDYFSFHAQYASELQKVAVFDALANNADRKGGHCLLDRRGRLWVIDHGLTFNTDPKLRTVLWDWSGQAIPSEIVERMREVRPHLEPGEKLWARLRKLLAGDELDALARRWDGLLERPIFPLRGPYRSVPWPPF